MQRVELAPHTSVEDTIADPDHKPPDQRRLFLHVQAHRHACLLFEGFDEDRAVLVETLEEKTGMTVRLHVEKEPALIGGLVVRIGDRVFDGSVRSQLNALHDRFRNAALSGSATNAAA